MTPKQRDNINNFIESLDGWSKQKVTPKGVFATSIDGHVYMCPLAYYTTKYDGVVYSAVAGGVDCSRRALISSLYESLTRVVVNSAIILNDDDEERPSHVLAGLLREKCVSILERDGK